MLSFDPTTLPWTDRPDFEAQLQQRLTAGLVNEEEAGWLRQWNRDGYMLFRQAIPHEAIDTAWENYRRAVSDRPVCRALLEGRGTVLLSELNEGEDLGSISNYHFRFMDFHSISGATKAVMMNSKVVRFLELAFGQPPVAMQTLMFEYGSEQDWHQDFPYVVPRILSHLAASWAACEPITPENGPLEYFPGSHRFPFFDWGNGSLTYAHDDYAKVGKFADYLRERAAQEGIQPVQLAAEKGDVFLWHAALAHRGAPVLRKGATRRSIVSHYSTRPAYPIDQRAPQSDPIVHRLNGGYYYQSPLPGAVEDFYPYPNQVEVVTDEKPPVEDTVSPVSPVSPERKQGFLQKLFGKKG
jgi:ectoine hydroxylase-related dioxygenase (phytanoyl-CoA dioxygenase family)